MLPGEDSRHGAERASCLTQDVDRWVIPEGFVWDIDEAIKNLAIRSMQQSAIQNKS